MAILTQCESCNYTFMLPPIRRDYISLYLCPVCRKKRATAKQTPNPAHVYEPKPTLAMDIIFDDPDYLEILDPVR